MLLYYSVLRDYETQKTTGAPAPASLAPMIIIETDIKVWTWISVVPRRSKNIFKVSHTIKTEITPKTRARKLRISI